LLYVHNCRPALSAADTPVTSITLVASLRLLTRVNPPDVGWNWNCCACVPLQVYCWMTVPLATPAARASTHFPLPLLASWYHAVGDGWSTGGVVPPPPSHFSASIMNWFCAGLSNVDESRVLVS